MSKERDQQRSRVYKAEKVLSKFAEPLPKVNDVERYVKEVWKSKRVQNAFPKAVRPYVHGFGQTYGSEPTVKDGRGIRKAKGHQHWIAIPLWARNSYIVTHELAHTITRREHGTKVAGHGWQYCEIYLTLVLYMLGREAHDVLKASFKQHRVRFTKPRERKPLSPERREQMIAILAYARAKRQALKVA